MNALGDLVKEGTVVNPFNKTSLELITLDTGEVMDPAIVDCLKNAPTIGKKQLHRVCDWKNRRSLQALVRRNKKPNLYTFSNRPPADLKKGADKLGSAKANAALVTKLFLQARPEADVDAFFKHANQREPPSSSNRGKLLQGTKSDIIACLPGMPAPGRSKAVKEATVVILYMAAVIHVIKPQRRCNCYHTCRVRWRKTYQEWTQSGTHTMRRVSSHKLVPSGVRLHVVEHESLPRYISPKETNGRSSSKITKIMMRYSNA